MNGVFGEGERMNKCIDWNYDNFELPETLYVEGDYAVEGMNEEIRYNKMKKENERLRVEIEELKKELKELIEENFNLRRHNNYLEDKFSYVDFLI